MITNQKGHTGNTILCCVLITKLFLTNPNKAYSISDIQEYLSQHKVRAHHNTIGRIIYFISSIADIEEESKKKFSGARKYYTYRTNEG